MLHIALQLKSGVAYGTFDEELFFSLLDEKIPGIKYCGGDVMACKKMAKLITASGINFDFSATYSQFFE